MPNSTSGHHAITRLEVRGGFLDGAIIQFSAGLNCLIGGRGAGKTTALEFLRYGLGLMPDQKAQRHRTIDSLIKTNLERGQLTIEVRTHAGLGYTAHRSYGAPTRVINEMGNEVPAVLDRDQVFSADIFSQNEIEDIALDRSAQLPLLDRFEDVNIAAISQELLNVRASLRQSAEELRRLDDEIDELKIQAADASVLRERLRGLSSETGPDAERLTAAHNAQAARIREAQIAVSALAALESFATNIRESEASFRASMDALAAAKEFEVNSDVTAEMRVDIAAATETVSKALESVRGAIAAADLAIRRRAQRLTARHAEQEVQYQALLDASNEEVLAGPPNDGRSRITLFALRVQRGYLLPAMIDDR